MQHDARDIGGFTTIELLVSLAIMSVVIIQTLGLFVSQQQTFHVQQRVVAAQEDARLAADMMHRDVRMAGFMVTAFAGISTRDGDTTASDVLCVSDPSVLDATKIDEAMSRFDRAVITPTAVAGGDSSVTISSNHADIDGDGDDDFEVDHGIIISDGTQTWCAHVTSVSPTSIGFDPPTPGGVVVAATTGRAVPAVIYQRTGAGLERNRKLLSSQVEDVQVAFGLDLDDDGVIAGAEFPIHDIKVANTNQIQEVRVSVLTRTRTEDPKLTGNGRQKVGNRAASGTPDAYRRRLAVLRAAPRNLL